MKKTSLKQFVLCAELFGGYINLDKKGRVDFEEDISKALVFDERDNMELKRRFYQSLTGLELTIKELP